jgi:glycosyltransferase involved in cell wall biosynthesis
MKILFGYRYGVVGGVCTQLAARLTYLSKVAEVEVFLSEDHGAAAMLSALAPVHVGRPDDFARIAGAFDVVSVIDTPELIRAVHRRPLVVEVHTTTDGGLAYLSEIEHSGPYLVPSPYSRRLLAERFGVASDRITVVPNIVDGDRFRPLDVERLGRPALSWVGKLDRHKNWEGFLELAALVCQMVPGLEVYLLGGETAPDAAVESLFATIDDLDLCRNVRWFPRVAHASMPRVHSAVGASGGLTVVTSRDESFGMSVAEALLCGCPAVVPRVGALPELAPGAPFAALYEPNDRAAAAATILDVLRHHREVRSTLLRERAALAERWSAERVGSVLLARLEAHARERR